MQFAQLKRREFISLLGGAAAWPLPARAQQAMADRVRRIGVLIGGGQDDPEVKNYSRAFQEGLRSLGWLVGQNLSIELRVAPNPEKMLSAAAELVKFAPELIVTLSTPATSSARQAASGLPIVFVAVSDPIGAGCHRNAEYVHDCAPRAHHRASSSISHPNHISARPGCERGRPSVLWGQLNRFAPACCFLRRPHP